MTKSTITREQAELRAFITGFLTDQAHDKQSADSLTAKVFRIALAAMDSEPVGEFYEDGPLNWYQISDGDRVLAHRRIPLYRHAQPAPVVPDDVLDALQKVARIRLDLDEFDGDRRGIADCLCDAEEALIEVVNRRADMLNGGKP
ncbi:hypothetical protein [Klebsiella aerogenes]|nr:hypothetical protein [Klebsiella aerogenes]